MEIFCQILVALWLFLDYISNLRICIEGQKAKKPSGTGFAVGLTIGIILLVFIFTKAGSFDKLF